MKPSTRFVFFFAVLAAPLLLRADGQSDATVRAKAVAPYVDDMTAVVAHVDLSGVAAVPLVETLAGIIPDAVDLQGGNQSETAERSDRFVKSFVQAGVKEVYITISLGEPGPFPRILAIVPLSATADEKAVRAALAIPADAGRRIGDALVIRLSFPEPEVVGKPTRFTDNRPFDIRPSQRPELAAAFEAAGEGTVQVVLIPPPYTRRVIEELMPQLPQEIGGGPSGILTRGISWAAAGINLPPQPSLHVVIKSQDAPAAEALHGKFTDVLRGIGQQKATRSAVPQFDLVAALLTPKIEGDRLIFTLDSKTPAIDTLVAAVKTSTGQARKASDKATSMNNAKQIALAMHNYYSTFNNHFPAAASCGPDGKPLLSWRVYLLPWIEQDQLFKQFHLNEPWDSPHNKTLIEKMPFTFRSPRSKAGKGKTNYLVPVGNGALYASSREEPKFKDIKDGLSQTIMIVEVDDPHAVIWTKPADLAFDPMDPKKGIGSLYDDGFVAAFCDASTRFLPRGIDPKTLSALFTRAGGEVIAPY
jgi:hypothetical protein